MSSESLAEEVGVIGAGQMGTGIAQVAAYAGFRVVLADASLDLARRGKDRIAQGLLRLVEKGKLSSADRDQILERLHPAGDVAAFSRAGLVIEAVTEDESVKREVFRRLDEVVPPRAILASNTSSISITRLAAATKRPDRVIGMHFMIPVPVMKLVEIIRGITTSDETYRAVVEMGERLGKTVVTAKDLPGFLVNRMLMPMVNEAIYALHEGVGTVEDIDQAMVLGANHPMGPLALADLIGLDTVLAICEVLHRVFGEDKYRPCPLLRQYVDAGWLGRKAGRGFHRYEATKH